MTTGTDNDDDVSSTTCGGRANSHLINKYPSFFVLNFLEKYKQV